MSISSELTGSRLGRPHQYGGLLGHQHDATFGAFMKERGLRGKDNENNEDTSRGIGAGGPDRSRTGAAGTWYGSDIFQARTERRIRK